MEIALLMKVLKILNELNANLDDCFKSKFVLSVSSQELLEVVSQFFHYDVLEVSAFKVTGQDQLGHTLNLPNFL